MNFCTVKVQNLLCLSDFFTVTLKTEREEYGALRRIFLIEEERRDLPLRHALRRLAYGAKARNNRRHLEVFVWA